MIRRHLLASAAAFTFAVLPAAAFAQDAEEQAAEETVEIADEGTAAGNDDDLIFLTEEEEELKNLEAEMTEAFSIFGDFFKVDPLTDAQEARLPQAQKMADKVMPEGSFVTAMDEMMGPMMGALTAEITSDPRTQLSSITGIETEELEQLDDDAAQNALNVFDPQFTERSEKTTAAMIDMIGQMIGAMEPYYRDAMAKAFAVRFETTEMDEILAFFATPTGEKYALASYLVNYDPQMLGVMEQMGPAIMEVLPGMMTKFEELEASFPEARNFSELSEAERSRVADLLGRPTTELDALVPADEDEDYAEETADEDVI